MTLSCLGCLFSVPIPWSITCDWLPAGTHLSMIQSSVPKGLTINFNSHPLAKTWGSHGQFLLLWHQVSLTLFKQEMLRFTFLLKSFWFRLHFILCSLICIYPCLGIYKFHTVHGKPGKSYNLRISVSRAGKSWNLIVGHGKSWKITVCVVCKLLQVSKQGQSKMQAATNQ